MVRGDASQHHRLLPEPLAEAGSEQDMAVYPRHRIPHGTQRVCKHAQMWRNGPFRDLRQHYLAVDDDLHDGPLAPPGLY